VGKADGDVDHAHRVIDASGGSRSTSPVELREHAPVRVREEMPVEVEGDANRRVSHLRLEVLRVRAGGDHQRGVRVAKVVEANGTDSAASHGRREDPVAEVVVVEDLPAWRRENESELVRLARDE